MKIRSFIAWVDPAGDVRVSPPPDGSREFAAAGLRVRYQPRRATAATDAGLPTLLLGDDSEWDATRADANLAGSVPIRYDDTRQELVISTSIVALPPVFLFRRGSAVAVTSDLHLLRDTLDIRLDLDPTAVVELGHFGHPVAHRTLFRDVEIVAAAGRLRLGKRGATFERTWALPERSRLDWPQFIEAQIAAFTEQVKRLDLTGSFLSLTAGLDTRTVFAALASQGRLVPAATMTGPTQSLDARIAARLARAYGTPHHPVTFDDRFIRELPRYIETASRLSGGHATIGQAPEVYMYDVLGPSFDARLSGNLGNQVGRGGTEGISVRGADLGVLSPALRGSGAPRGHWLLKHLDRDERDTLHFILHSEIPFTLVGNFNIGNHFAAQQSPYASRGLIETLAARPATRAGAPSGSKLRMRLRDLRHRFLGEPEHHSFQRTLVKRIDGFAARCPVNWGWRPQGGVSPTGLAWGTATLVGMFARAKGLDGGVLRVPMQWTGLPALHDFRESRRWLRESLRAFTEDTLRSRALTEAGLFDPAALDHVLGEHFTGRRDHYETVTFALDVACAHRIFCQ